MDISFPTHSTIKKVSFEYTTPESVRRLSVKQVTTSQIFDSLNNPVPGGLYDPAMGPVDKNGRCPTCSQTAFQCPGHFGHIELAVPVYAPMNFGSMYQLLRQICFYCHRLRSSRVRVALTTAKLRLLQAGLLMEAVELDAWLESQSENSEADLEAAEDAGISTEHVIRLDESVIIDRLHRRVKSLIQKHKAEGTIVERKSAALQAQRQLVIDEFLKKAPTSNTCAHCKSQVHGLHRHANTKVFLLPNKKHSSSVSEDSLSVEGMKYMTPIHIYTHLKKVWANEHVLLELLYCGGMGNVKERPDFRLFFTEVISVPPCRFRPPSVFGDSQFDHPQNTYLTEILKLNQRIIDLRQEPKDIDQDEQDPKFANLMQTWISLQEQVNYLFDSSRNQPLSGKIAPAGIKQILEKKEGLFRKHMMGKRVNFAARSVISPDAQIETSEIGVPLVFAKRLTFPEPVTDYNVEKLCQAVINGPDQYPGASHVEMEDGTLVSLEFMNQDARRQLAMNLQAPPRKAEFAYNNKKVLRHIADGDSVIMNRQPTLHKPSMMSHRVKVLQGEKTLRMHYANCNTYNADFDGDEMNLHFPQNQLARAEAQMIANTNRQYLGCTDGSPLRGLIQDHISTGVILSIKDTMFDREVFQQLLFGALPQDIGPVQFPPPAICHPKRLWTGKQLVSAVLMNLTKSHAQLNLTSNSRCPGKLLKGHPEESQVIVVNGHILTGIMDKSQFGASAYGITHACYELYGPDCAGQLLTAMGRLFTRYDQYYGFTCRMDDILLTEAADKKRRQLIDASQSSGKQVVAEFCQIPNPDTNRAQLKSAMERASRSDEQLKALDGAMKGKMNECTSKVIEACLPDGQLVPFPKNNMALMTQTGAKGSMVNFSQISGCLGQQELEGRRVPMMVSGKTLPSFRPWDTRPRAGGYITQRFLTGIRPQEFFFHCMAGREGLIDTAVKTSRSGYLQRCLIKHLEALRVHYDHTVRDDDGTVVQFRYGEDGLDVTKQKYLNKLSFAADNFAAIIASHPPEALDRVDTEEARKAGKKALRHPERHDPVLSLFPPSAHLGAVGEKFAKQLEDFIEKQPGVDGKQFRALMWLKYMRSLADPGEAVGLLAAQSIGEPSTQMTLNTFHFAGFGAKNVTLGIPRLREIIMTASQKLKTPMMTVALKPEYNDQVGRLAALLSRVNAKQLVSGVEISERLDSTQHWRGLIGADRARIYSIRIILGTELPVGLTIDDVRNCFENSFLIKLMAAIDRQLKRTTKAAVAKADELVQSIAEARSKSAFAKSSNQDHDNEEHQDDEEDDAKSRKKRKDFADDDEDHDGNDMDASDAKAAARRKQAATYDEGDEEEDLKPADDSDIEPNEPEATPEEESAPVEDLLRYSKIAEFGNVRDFLFTASQVSFSLCYPASAPKLLMLDIIEKVIAETVVRQVPSVSKAFPNPPSSSAPIATITTEGVNLRGLWEWACSAASLSAMLDMDTITSNDICAVLSTFGVEAARATIVSEIAGVFGVYGISVDPRHLSLIADYMTLDGGYRPFNRMGISHSVSPLLKMSFETTVGFLKQAVLLGDHDELETPASRIVLGQPVKLGTGSFEVLQKLVMN